MIRIACAWGIIAAAVPAAALAGTLRDARVTVLFSPGACDVASRFVLDTSEPEIVEHRLMLRNVNPPKFVVLGGIADRADIVGRTARLRISLTGSGRNEYRVRYAVPLPDGAADRCPLLVPSAPTDGMTRAVRIDVEVPVGTRRLPGEFPAFAWDDRRGVVTISHLPSFVRVPQAAEGTPVAWRDTLNVRRALDVAAVATIGIMTLAWMAFRRRRA